jgi:N-hydroxyarylamine O-acetyltransferase
MPTKEGRITLTDTHFKVIKDGSVSETPVKNDDEFSKCLKNNFRLDLDQIKSGKE